MAPIWRQCLLFSMTWIDKGSMMGLLDQLSDALSGGALGSLLESSGGLSGLVERFQQAGLGETVQSWISQGENLPVSVEQLQAALGPDTLSALAEKLGVDPAQSAILLSNALPQWVDQLTPDCQLPDV